jgi:chromosome segregation ATPase
MDDLNTIIEELKGLKSKELDLEREVDDKHEELDYVSKELENAEQRLEFLQRGIEERMADLRYVIGELISP